MNLTKSFSEKYGTLLVFLAALMWATDAPFRVHLTSTLSSEFIVLIEHFISILLLSPILLPAVRELKTFNKKEWVSILIIGFGGSALSLVLFTQAFAYMNPSVVIILQKVQPFIAIFLATYILNEFRNKKFWFWALVAIVGAYVVSFPDFAPQLYEGEVFNPNIIGILLALGAALLWGSSTVLGRYLLVNRDFKTITALRFLTAFVFLLGWNVANSSITQISHLTATDWLFLIIIAIVSGVVSLFIYYKGLSHTKASVATIAELGFVGGAVIINYFFLNATLVPMQVLGMLVILFAVWRLNKVSNVETQS
ncbi:DMT family transporter [Candidatus Nomurabacteria bacterium]|nr:DMT family transporter [Candidatus Nomurabacteria bacterium]